MIKLITLIFISYLINAQVNEYKKLSNQIYDKCKYITDNFPGRPAGSFNNLKLQNYLLNEFSQFGLTVKKDSFRYENKKYVNIIAKHPGRDSSKTILVSAHYDTYSEIVPGANDNGSGLAVLLKLAEEMSKNQPAYNIVFLAFDGEEEGLIGSRFFAQKIHNKMDVLYLLNIDMIAKGIINIFSTKEGIPNWIVDEIYSSQDLSLFNKSALYYNLLKVFQFTGRSDHLPFIKYKIPVISISSEVFPGEYHSKKDVMTIVNPENLLQSYLFSKNLLMSLTNKTLNMNIDYSIINIPFNNNITISGSAGTFFLVITVLAIIVLLIKKSKIFFKTQDNLSLLIISLPFFVFIIFFFITNIILKASFEEKFFLPEFRTFYISISLLISAFLSSLFFINKRIRLGLKTNFNKTILIHLLIQLIILVFISKAVTVLLIAPIVLSIILILQSRIIAKAVIMLIIILCFINLSPLTLYKLFSVDAGIKLGGYIEFITTFFLFYPWYLLLLFTFKRSSVAVEE